MASKVAHIDYDARKRDDVGRNQPSLAAPARLESIITASGERNTGIRLTDTHHLGADGGLRGYSTSRDAFMIRRWAANCRR